MKPEQAIKKKEKKKTEKSKTLLTVENWKRADLYCQNEEEVEPPLQLETFRLINMTYFVS